MQITQEGIITRCTHTVNSYETDFQMQLRLSALLNLFQELANQSANQLGFGYTALQAKACFWALSRLRLHIHALPHWGDTLVLETWPKAVDGLFARRDWQVKTTDGNLLIACTSGWLLVDLPSRRPLRIHQRLEGFQFAGAPHALELALPKLSAETDSKAVWAHTVRYADLDQNRHVNNVRYFDWMMNAFDTSFLEGRQLQEFEINIVSELQEHDEVSLHIGTTHELAIPLSIAKADGRPVAIARTLWKQVSAK